MKNISLSLKNLMAPKTSNHRKKYFKEDSRVVAVRIDPEIFDLLQVMAEDTGANSISYVLRSILAEYFAERLEKNNH